jgi:RHS repeat-associated protein
VATTQVNAGPAPYWQTFSYDQPTGNRTATTDYNPAGDTTKDATTRYTYGNTAQPHTVTATAKTVNSSTVTGNYGYDPAGNTTARQDGASQDGLTWNPEGRLDSETTTPGGTTQKASYVYDASGTQLIRRDPSTNTATLYLGATEVHLNTTTGTVTGNRYFGYAGAPTVIESGGTNPTLSYQAGNQQGTNSAVIAAAPTAAANAVTARRAYTPFNTPRGTANTAATWNQAFLDDHTFLGKTTDTTTGLVDIGARKYDPGTGRFVSIDPVFQPGSPQTIGGYAYAGNDPVSASDPTGLVMCNAACQIKRDDEESAKAAATDASYAAQAGFTGTDAVASYYDKLWRDALHQQELAAIQRYRQHMIDRQRQMIQALLAKAQDDMPDRLVSSLWDNGPSILGHVLQTTVGLFGTFGGGMLFASGTAECGTGVLCLAGAPSMAAGGAIAVPSAKFAVAGGQGLAGDLQTVYSEATTSTSGGSEPASSDAQEIAKHALARSNDGSPTAPDHVIPGIPHTQAGYEAYADSVMDSRGVRLGYRASDDSTAYWDAGNKAIIIVSTKGENTMFLPRNGIAYFTDNFQPIGTT